MKRIVIELGIGEKTNIGDNFYLIENNFVSFSETYFSIKKY